MCALAVGAATFATSTVQAVPCVVTISGTASYQDYNKNDDAVIKKHSISQKMVMQLLAIATGEPSITNKPTKLLYDPDVLNEAALDSSEDFYSYGVFYVTNSALGLYPLQGIDINGDYWSYIEMDSYILDHNSWLEERLGFSYPYVTEYNSVTTEGKNSGSIIGNAILYIHSNRNYYDITGANSNQSSLYYANNWDGYLQSYALVIRGLITANGSDNGTKMTESFSLQGSGDGLWYDSDLGHVPLVISGKAKASGKGPSFD